MDMAVHAFDIAEYFIGRTTALSCRTETLRKNIPVDDNVVVLLEFRKDALSISNADGHLQLALQASK